MIAPVHFNLKTDVETFAQEIDRSPHVVARSLIRLMRKGLVYPDAGTVEEAVTELLRRYPQASDTSETPP